MNLALILFYCTLIGGVFSTLDVLRTDKSMIKPTSKHRLAILTLLDNYNTPSMFLPFPMTNIRFDSSTMMGNEDPADKRCSLAAAKFVLDHMNSRDDILPEYELEFYYNGGPSLSAIYAVQFLFEFLAIFESEGSGNLLNSRYIFGPSLTCTGQLQASVSYTLTRLLGFADVTIQAPVVCSKENGLQTKGSFIYALLALLNFVKTVGWQQIGLISGISTETSSPMSYAVEISKIAISNGLDVIHFGFDSNYYNMFMEIKQNSRVRIILMMSYSPSPFYCIYLWCAAYKAGIRAPKYVLLLPNGYCASYITKPIDVPPGFKLFGGRTFESCSPTIQIMQAKMTVFSDQMVDIRSDDQQLDKVAEQLSNYQSGAVFIPNKDVRRAQNLSGCTGPRQNWIAVAEKLQSSAIRLDIAEKQLRLRNSSIAELSRRKNNKTLSNLYNDIAREVIYKTDWYNEMRQAIVFQVAVGNTKTDDVVISNRHLHQTRYRFIVNPNEKMEIATVDFSNFNVTELNKAEWQTETGTAPSDLSHVLRIRGDVDSKAALPLTIAACAQALVLILIATLAGQKLTSEKTTQVNHKRSYYFDYKNNFVILYGCVLTSLSVAILMYGSVYFLRQMCPWRPIFIVTGLTLTNAMLFAKMQVLPTFTQLHHYIRSVTRLKDDFNLGDFERKRAWDLKQVRWNARKGFLAIFALAVVAQVTWCVSDPMTWAIHVEYEDDPLFDVQKDAYYDIKIEYCTSYYQMYFIWGFVIFHALMLVIGSFISATLKRPAKYLRKRFSDEVQLSRLAIVNATTIFLFFVLLLTIVQKWPAHLTHLQPTLISLGLLLQSSTTSLIIFYPYWRPSNWHSRIAQANSKTSPEFGSPTGRWLKSTVQAATRAIKE